MSFGHELPLDSARHVSIFIGCVIYDRGLLIKNQIVHLSRKGLNRL